MFYLEGNSLVTGYNTMDATFSTNTSQYTTPAYLKTYKAYELLPDAVKNAAAAVIGLGQAWFFFVEGMKDTVDVLYSIIRTRQYALQQIGHGEYNRFNSPDLNSNWNGTDRFRLPVGAYVRDQLFQLPTYQAQNL